MISIPAWIERVLMTAPGEFTGRIEMNVFEDGIADCYLWRKNRQTHTYTGERFTAQ